MQWLDRSFTAIFTPSPLEITFIPESPYVGKSGEEGQREREGETDSSIMGFDVTC